VGDGKLNAAVIDSGPLIHLAEIGCLRFLSIFDTVCITHAVWLETVEQNRISQNDLFAITNIQEFSPPQSEVARFVKENNLTELHTGEQECLCLCRQRDIPTLLTDDMAVRNAAKLLNLVPVGSSGIIVAACKREVISLQDAECHIADLYDISSLFVTRDIVDLAISQLRTLVKADADS
jgi:predicted nucleic acid-binding protein